MTLQERLKQAQSNRAKAADRNKAIIKEQKALLEQNEKLSDEQRTQFDALTAEFDQNKATIEECNAEEATCNALIAREQATSNLVPRQSSAASGTPVASTNPSTPGTQLNIEQPEGEREQVNLVPGSSLSHPADIRIVVNRPKLQAFSGIRNGLSPEQRAFRAGNWVIATMASALPTSVPTALAARCIQFCADHMLFPHDSSGFQGFVPEEFDADMIVLRERYGVARNIMQIVPMSSDTKRQMKWVDGMAAQFVGPLGSTANDEPQVVPVNLVAKKIRCAGVFSADLEADSVADIGDIFMNEMSRAFAIREDQAAFNGDGSDNGNYGGINGINNYLINTGTKGCPDATGTTWAAITYADIMNLFALLPSYAEEAGNVEIVCHKAFYFNVLLPLTTSLGGADRSDVENMPGYMFNGVPVRFAQVMPSVTPASSSVTQVAMLLGDFRMAGMFGDRRSMQFKFTDQATVGGVNTWDEDQIGVKATERIDVNWHDLGDSTTAGSVVGLKQTGP